MIIKHQFNKNMKIESHPTTYKGQINMKSIKNHIKIASQGGGGMRIMDLDQYLEKMNTITEFIWILN